MVIFVFNNFFMKNLTKFIFYAWPRVGWLCGCCVPDIHTPPGSYQCDGHKMLPYGFHSTDTRA